ncbi:hypothetical protein EPN18_07530 [bacterium]|nr:MAG: hypothetical protein EPN18_07530 [bacterium]
MRLTVNFADTGKKHRLALRKFYIVFSICLILTMSGNIYWYLSFKADAGRYAEMLKREHVAKKTGPRGPQGLSAEKRQLLVKKAAFVNGVISAKAFSWSLFFYRLEKEATANVSLTSISQKLTQGGLRISINGVAKDLPAITVFAQKLDKSCCFKDVSLKRTSVVEVTGERLVSFSMEMEYIGA